MLKVGHAPARTGARLSGSLVRPLLRPRQRMDGNNAYAGPFAPAPADKGTHGWKEFKRGTQTYWILLTLSMLCLPSPSARYSAVAWWPRAEAAAHVVAAPGEGETEESKATVVKRA